MQRLFILSNRAVHQVCWMWTLALFTLSAGYVTYINKSYCSSCLFLNLCLTDLILYFQCFTRGFEYKKHRSDHRYEIMVSVLRVLFSQSVPSRTLNLEFLQWKQTSDFPVLEPGWTAQEEMALLEAVMDCGFGNWWVTWNMDLSRYSPGWGTRHDCSFWI